MANEAQAVEPTPAHTPEIPPYERCSCLRCGHDWKARNPNSRPTGCPRCGSALWDKPPMRANARRPSDAPNPNWRFREKAIKRKCPTCGRAWTRLTVRERLRLEAKERDRLAAEAEAAARERPARPVAPAPAPVAPWLPAGISTNPPQELVRPRGMTPPPSMRQPQPRIPLPQRPRGADNPETVASRSLAEELEEKTK